MGNAVVHDTIVEGLKLMIGRGYIDHIDLVQCYSGAFGYDWVWLCLEGSRFVVVFCGLCLLRFGWLPLLSCLVC